MGALILAIEQIIQQGEGMVVRHYGKKYGSGGMFFNAVICFFGMIFFFVTDKEGLIFTSEVLGYGLLSCLMFATGFYMAYVSYRTGPFMLTRLLSSFSGLITIFYGIVVLKEKASVFTYLGIFLVFVCVFLMRYQKYSPIDERRKRGFSLVWIISIVLNIASNGLIGVISRTQQIRFNHAYDNEFMIISFGGASIALLIFELIKEGTSFKDTLKYSVLYGTIGGLCNGAKKSRESRFIR